MSENDSNGQLSGEVSELCKVMALAYSSQSNMGEILEELKSMGANFNDVKIELVKQNAMIIDLQKESLRILGDQAEFRAEFHKLREDHIQLSSKVGIMRYTLDGFSKFLWSYGGFIALGVGVALYVAKMAKAI